MWMDLLMVNVNMNKLMICCTLIHLMSLANTNTGFPDLVGEVRGIKTSYNEETQST
ncbi:unnamed protein product [Brassica oleracea]